MGHVVTHDNINYTIRPGAMLFVLGPDDVIEATDLVRPRWDTEVSPYVSQKWRPTAWHRADQDLTAWVGKTYRDLLTHRDKNSYGVGETIDPSVEYFQNMSHEIVRVIW